MFGAYNDDEFSKFQTVMYLMLNGPAWSIGLSIIIYICNTGYGGVVNSYLSWSVWEPLAKMIFGVLISVSHNHHIHDVQHISVRSDLNTSMLYCVCLLW